MDYLDSPISGGQPGGAGTDGAKAANVTFMVSGNQEAFERAKPVMEGARREVLLSGRGGNGDEGETAEQLR